MRTGNRKIRPTEASTEPVAAPDTTPEAAQPAQPATRVRPVLARITRPLAKGAIKGGLILYDKGKEAAAELRARLGGLVTEARTELRDQRATAHRERSETTPDGSPNH